MNKQQAIDCMIDADKRLQEGYLELKMCGSNRFCEALVQFVPLTSIPTIINLFQAIKDSDKSDTVKVVALEGLAAGLSEIAMELGFVGNTSKELNNYKPEQESKVDYTSEEFWKDAPEGATHWGAENDSYGAGWYKDVNNNTFTVWPVTHGKWYTSLGNGGCLSDRELMPRPSN